MGILLDRLVPERRCKCWPLLDEPGKTAMEKLFSLIYSDYEGFKKKKVFLYTVCNIQLGMLCLLEVWVLYQRPRSMKVLLDLSCSQYCVFLDGDLRCCYWYRLKLFTVFEGCLHTPHLSSFSVSPWCFSLLSCCFFQMGLPCVFSIYDGLK